MVTQSGRTSARGGDVSWPNVIEAESRKIPATLVHYVAWWVVLDYTSYREIYPGLAEYRERDKSNSSGKFPHQISGNT